MRIEATDTCFLMTNYLAGEWMNNSAGVAFAPHVITVGVGEVRCLLKFDINYDAHIALTCMRNEILEVM